MIIEEQKRWNGLYITKNEKLNLRSASECQPDIIVTLGTLLILHNYTHALPILYFSFILFDSEVFVRIVKIEKDYTSGGSSVALLKQWVRVAPKKQIKVR